MTYSYENHLLTEVALYFVRSGYVYIINGRFELSGVDSYGWSSWPYSNGVYAYTRRFNGDSVYPSNVNGRWDGHSLRCLAN